MGWQGVASFADPEFRQNVDKFVGGGLLPPRQTAVASTQLRADGRHPDDPLPLVTVPRWLEDAILGEPDDEPDDEDGAVDGAGVTQASAYRTKLAFLLDVGPRGGCSHEEAGWRERCRE